jgi:hypothetical protein
MSRKRKTCVIPCFAMLIFGLMFAVAAVGQVGTSGSVRGTVTDSTGAVIASANVALRNVDTGSSMTIETDAVGAYLFPVVPVGRYEMTVTEAGFKKYVQSEFEVNAAEPIRINVVLAVGQVSETVTVVEAPPVVDTVTASEGNTVTGEQVNSLPLTNRIFTQLVYLEPGVSAGINQEPGFGSNSSVDFSINGVRSDENNLMIDGVRNVDTFGGNAFVTPNLFAISEFRVESNDYSATSGRSAGGQVNLISKAGTNAFHGNAFEYFRNDKLNAINALATTQAEDRWNDFGYTFGGPIKKDRLFFFWSQEWRRIIQGSGPNITVTPTDAERAGDFRGKLTGVMASPCPNAAASDPEFDTGTVFDPATKHSFTCADGTVVTVASPFSYNGQINVIDPSRIDPNATLLLKTYFPEPTPGYHYGTIYNFISQAPNFTKWREEMLRMDYNLSDKLHLYGRYSGDSVFLSNPYGLWGENPFPYVGGSTQNFPIYNAAVHLSYTPNSSFTSEFTWGLYFGNDKSLKNTDESNLDRAPGLTIHQIFPLNEGNHIPTMYFSGDYTGIIEQWWFHNDAFGIPFTSDNTWIKGKHTVRFGGTVMFEGKSELSNPSSNNTNGSYTFAGNFTAIDNFMGNSMADFLLGDAYNYTETQYDHFGKYRWWDYEPYVEDQIKARRNVTLTLGLRYELYMPEYEKTNQFASFSPSLYSAANAPTVNPDGTITPGTGSLTNGIMVAGQNSPYGRALFPTHYNAFAPRIGVAWDVFGDGKMSVRSGYGIFYDRWPSFSQFGANNPPFNQTVNIYDTTLDNPGGVAGTLYPTTLSAVLPPWKYPSVQKWSLGVQREVLKGTSLSVAYVGTKGTHLLGALNINQPYPNADIADWNVAIDTMRPYQGYSTITAYTNAFDSNYNALQVSVIHRLSRGLSFQISYTYSKTLTDSQGGAWGEPEDSLDPSRDRGPAPFDMTHMLVANYTYELPFFRQSTGFKKAALAGWQVTGITAMQSGGPLTITYAADQAGIGGWGERVNMIGNPKGPKTVNEWFNVNAFEVQPLGTVGNEGVGVVRGPGIQNWDLGLNKEFTLHETKTLKFEAEGFNAFNHPNLSSVNTSYGSTGFGMVTGRTAPRMVQLALVLTF